MKNKDLKAFTEYFGTKLPIEKIKNRDTRVAVIGLYSSLAKAWDEVSKEIETIRTTLTEGHLEELQEYEQLILAGDEKSREKANEMTECVRIYDDFSNAVNALMETENTSAIRKISLEILFDALLDCGFPGLEKVPVSILLLQQMFNDIIN